MMLMLFSALFCTFILFPKKPKCKKLQQNLLLSTETVSDLSKKCEQEVQTDRYVVGRWVGRGRAERPQPLLKRNGQG